MRILATPLLVAGCTPAAPPAPSAGVRPDSQPVAGTLPPGALPAGAMSPDSLMGAFDGYYSAGFEHTGFVPCADSTGAWWAEPAMSETRIAPDQVRLDMDPAADIHARYTDAVGDDEVTFGHGVKVWARLSGRASPRRDGASGNGYGHLGAYAREVTVDSVEALARDTTVAGCPAPASVRP